MRLSLRYKILGVLGFLLTAAVSLHTALSSLIFREEKAALLYDINHSIAVNTASQLRSSLIQTSDQLKLFVLSEVLGEQGDVRLATNFLQSSRVIGARLFKKGSSDPVNENLYVEIKTSGKFPAMTLERTQLVPLLKEADQQGFAFWSSSDGKGEPRFFLVSKIEIQQAQDRDHYFPVAELEGKPFFQTMQEANIFHSYLAKQNGEVLVAGNRNTLTASAPIEDHPLLKESERASEATRTGAAAFDYRGENWLGAYAPLGMGNLVFISQASRREVTDAIRTLIERSLLFGLIVLTATFIAGVLFSRKLTRNLRLLAEGAKQIGAGDLRSKIVIKSRDEVHDLAASFNAMADALSASREAIEKNNRELEEKVAERNARLQETNGQMRDVQEKLLQTTQLAAIGEAASRTVPEVLNPLTAIISRLERSRGVVGGETAPPRQLAEILGAWETDYKKGGMPSLSESLQASSSIHPELTIFEEDLDNLKKLAHFWQHQTEVVENDLSFVQEQVQRIHRVVEGMRELVHSSVKTNVDCGEALREAVATMSDFIAKQGIKITDEISASSSRAFLNRDEFIRLITHLIRNAFKAILGQADPAVWRKGTITVRATSANHLLLVDVLDNGPGIPEEKRGLLFEEGFTVETPSGGTGLGLSICRRYARAFGGEVELLYSEPDGRGTCFRVTIPLKEEPALAMAS